MHQVSLTDRYVGLTDPVDAVNLRERQAVDAVVRCFL
jgi:hypothetical protein